MKVKKQLYRMKELCCEKELCCDERIVLISTINTSLFLYIFSSNFNLKFNLLKFLTSVIDHDKGVQKSYRQTNFRSTECRISDCMDYVFCGEKSRREERGQDQHRWYCTGLTGYQSFLICAGEMLLLNLGA